MTKKLISVFALLAMFLTLAGCSNGNQKNTTFDTNAAQSAIEELNIYPMMVQVTDSDLATIGLTSDKIEKYMISIPLMNVQSSLYIAVLPKQGQEKAVKDELDAYMKVYENTWAQYLPDQSQLVENRMMSEIKTGEGTYYVYIISEDNQKVFDAMKKGIVENKA